MVVFHVTGGQIFRRGVVELGEQVGGQLAHGVDQHVQATAVGHANHHFLHALGTCGLDQLFNGSDKAFATFQGKAFLAHIFGVQVTLQAFGCGQAFQDALFLVGAEVGLAADGLQLLLPPAFFGLLRGVHVLGTQRAAVGLTQRIEQLTQRHAVFAEKGVAGVKHGFLISVGEAVETGLQVGNRRALGAFQWV